MNHALTKNERQPLGWWQPAQNQPAIGDRANPPTSLECEEQDSNLHALRTLEPKSSASANSATLACDGISEG